MASLCSKAAEPQDQDPRDSWDRDTILPNLSQRIGLIGPWRAGIGPLKSKWWEPDLDPFRSKLSSLIDSTPIGKRNFLICYQKARQESIIPLNIKSGWRTTGLWPVSVAKPLMSPLLLENSNKSIDPKLPKAQETLILPPKVSDTSIELQTPKVRKDLYLQIRTLASGSHDQLPTQRLLFRKVIKGIDEKEYELGKANMKIKELEDRLEHLRPKKKRKVQTSLNSKFVTIRAVKEAQIAAGER